MLLTGLLVVCVLHQYIPLARANGVELAKLTPNQAQSWLKASGQINTSTAQPRITILHLGDSLNIQLFSSEPNAVRKSQHVFKQNVNKRVDWYAFENELNVAVPSSLYDSCHGTLALAKAQLDSAGLYVYTDNQMADAVGVIVVSVGDTFQWMYQRKIFVFNDQSVLKNGSQLLLLFDAVIYYNANSDLSAYNKRINDIVQQASVTLDSANAKNIHLFATTKNLACQRHQQIAFDELRMVTLACTAQVTFHCPLQAGSSCWLEEKPFSNIRLNIDSVSYYAQRTVTVRIDV